jgi:hypothetical protein
MLNRNKKLDALNVRAITLRNVQNNASAPINVLTGHYEINGWTL